MAEAVIMNHAEEATQEQIPYFKFAEQMYLEGLKAGETKAKKEIEEELLKCYQGYPEEAE